MKKIVLLLSLITMGSIAYAQNSDNAIRAGVHEFEGTYKEALAKAKTEGKMLFIDCYTKWCGPCKLMSSQVFPDKEVGDFMNPKFIFMKLDIENGEGPEINKTFKVRAYPTYVILNNDGVEFSRFAGYKPTEAFIATLKAIFDKDKTLEALQGKYNSGNRDKEFLLEYIGTLSAENRAKELQNIVFEYMDNLTNEEKFDSKNWKYWTYYAYYEPEKNFTFLLENQSKFKVGQKVVTDFLVNVASGSYAMMTFDIHSEFSSLSKEEKMNRLANADDKVKRLDLENNPKVILYRASAIAKINGNIDEMLDTLERNVNNAFSESEKSSFMSNIYYSFRKVLTDAQKERLAEI